MKKFIIFGILVAMLAAILAGCGEKAPETMTFQEFDEKWRRADYEAFLADPSAFINDLMAVNRQAKCTPDDLPMKDGWESIYENNNEEKGFISSIVETDCVLFNKPCEYHADVIIYVKENTAVYMLSVQIENGDTQKDLDLAKALYFCCLDKIGEPTDVTIEYEDAKEADVLRILNGATKPNSFYMSFGDTTSLSFYAFENKYGADKGTFDTHVTIYATPAPDLSE